MEKPLAQALTSVAKTYFGELSGGLTHLSIDSYHYILVSTELNHDDYLDIVPNKLRSTKIYNHLI